MKKSLCLVTAIVISAAVGGCRKAEAEKAELPQKPRVERAETTPHEQARPSTARGNGEMKPRAGEAFLVLKDDSVLYLADLPVHCLARDFSAKFASYQNEWKSTDRDVPDMIESKPEVAAKLKEVDGFISEKKKQLLTVDQDARPAVLEALRGEEIKLTELTAVRSKSDEAHTEYLKITTPANEAIDKDDAALAKLAEEGRALVETTIADLNQIIAADRITLTKLAAMEPDRLFGLTDMTARNPDTDKIFDHLFVIRVVPETSRDGWATYFVAQKISGAFKGTRGEPVAREAFVKWEDLQTRRKAIDAERNAHVQRRKLEVAAWARRRNVDPERIDPFLEDHAEACRAVDEQGRVVDDLKSWGSLAVQRQKAEAQRLTETINGELAALAKQREAIVTAAVAAERVEVRKRFAAKFRELIEANTQAKVSTGSRGTFLVPPSGAYVFAEKKRENGDYFVWLARTDGDGPEVKLSNSTAVALAHESPGQWMLEHRLD